MRIKRGVNANKKRVKIRKLAKGYRGGKCVSGHVEGYILVDATDIGQLLQICIALLVARYGEQFTTQLLHTSILCDDDLRHLQEWNMYGYIGFVSVGLNPSSALGVYVDILLLEFGHIAM